MQFGFIGISFKQASLEVREKITFTDHKKIDFMRRAEQFGVEQCMILSTCNRSEIYYFYAEDHQDRAMIKLLSDFFPEVKVTQYAIHKIGISALNYLFRVTAGLESQVLGEDQILGQVKEALDLSRTMGYAKKELDRVVSNSIACAKKIKTEIKISEIPLSVSYIGILYLYQQCGIKGKRALVIGSGKMAALALRYLYDYEVGEVYLCSRMVEHARRLQEEFPKIRVMDYEDRYLILNNCDMVISATSSPHIVLKADGQKFNKDIVMLDLATPRDIDSSFREIENCSLFDLDHLQKIACDNEKERSELVSECEELINEDVEETLNWLLSSRMDATIESLHQRCEEIVQDSFTYLNRKMELSEREKSLLQKTLQASLHRLIREPIEELKHLETVEEQEHYKEIVHQLFQIESKR